MKLTDRQFKKLHSYASHQFLAEGPWRDPDYLRRRNLQGAVAKGGELMVDLRASQIFIDAFNANDVEKAGATLMEALCVYAIAQLRCDKPEAVSDDHDELLTAILNAGAELVLQLSEPTRSALQNELSKITTDDGKSKASATSLAETPEERRALWLEWYGDGKRGAVERVYERELLRNPKADRSNIGKQIKLAKEERAAKMRNGRWFAQQAQAAKR